MTNQERKLLLCILSLFVTVLTLSSGNTDTCDNNIPQVENARPTGNTTPPFPINHIINYHCDPGFASSAGLIRAKCTPDGNSAKWELSESRCRRISCGHPGDIENGRRIGEDFRFAKNVTYKCYTGYELIGFATIYCGTNGEWTRSAPTCKIVSCGAPPKPKNGFVTHTDVIYRSKADYSCNNSFRFVGTADQTITRECLADKTWSGSMPQCEEILCPPLPTGPDISVVDTSPDQNHVGKRVYFRCEGQDTQTTECTPLGTWTVVPGCGKIVTTAEPTKPPQPPSSTESGGIRTPCGEAPQIQHGTVTYVESQNAKYECKTGFTLKGSAVLKCLSSGKWDATPPSCEKKFPVGLVVGIVVAVLALIGSAITAVVLYKKKKSSAPPNKKKATPSDAVTMEEVQRLEKNNKPVPVTVL